MIHPVSIHGYADLEKIFRHCENFSTRFNLNKSIRYVVIDTFVFTLEGYIRWYLWILSTSKRCQILYLALLFSGDLSILRNQQRGDCPRLRALGQVFINVTLKDTVLYTKYNSLFGIFHPMMGNNECIFGRTSKEKDWSGWYASFPRHLLYQTKKCSAIEAKECKTFDSFIIFCCRSNNRSIPPRPHLQNREWNSKWQCLPLTRWMGARLPWCRLLFLQPRPRL